VAIEIRLTSEQFGFYKETLDKAKVAFTHRGNVIELTRSNHPVILKALQAAHAKSLALKTKSVTHFQRLYCLEQVINRVAGEGIYFIDIEQDNDEVTTEETLLAAIAAANRNSAEDNTEGVVEAA
jgi:hypothetical protein